MMPMFQFEMWEILELSLIYAHFQQNCMCKQKSHIIFYMEKNDTAHDNC